MRCPAKAVGLRVTRVQIPLLPLYKETIMTAGGALMFGGKIGLGILGAAGVVIGGVVVTGIVIGGIYEVFIK